MARVVAQQQLLPARTEILNAEEEDVTMVSETLCLFMTVLCCECSPRCSVGRSINASTDCFAALAHPIWTWLELRVQWQS